MSAPAPAAWHPGPPLWQLVLLAFAGGLAGSGFRAMAEVAAAAIDAPGWTARIFVNLTGAFLIGLLFATLCRLDAQGRPDGIPHGARLREHLLGAGFLGGFTTISGFSWDAAVALNQGDARRMGILLACNGLLGIVAAAFGYWLAMRARLRRQGAG